MMKIILASNNSHKLREFKQLVEGMECEIPDGVYDAMEQQMQDNEG